MSGEGYFVTRRPTSAERLAEIADRCRQQAAERDDDFAADMAKALDIIASHLAARGAT